MQKSFWDIQIKWERFRPDPETSLPGLVRARIDGKISSRERCSKRSTKVVKGWITPSVTTSSCHLPQEGGYYSSCFNASNKQLSFFPKNKNQSLLRANNFEPPSPPRKVTRGGVPRNELVEFWGFSRSETEGVPPPQTYILRKKISRVVTRSRHATHAANPQVGFDCEKHPRDVLASLRAFAQGDT